MEIQCEHCGKTFNDVPSHRRKFCSWDCSAAVNGKLRIVERVKFNCAVCGKEFQRGPGELREYRKKFGKDPLYCSMQCMGIAKRLKPKPCVICGNPIPIEWDDASYIHTNDKIYGRTRNGRAKICSSECRKKFKQAEWERLRPLSERTITKRVTKDGYTQIRHPRAGGRAGREMPEHRHIMEQHLGRSLQDTETVHHKNGDRSDNRLQNLELWSKAQPAGQRITDKIAWAIELFKTYPAFVAEAGFRLVPIGQ